MMILRGARIIDPSSRINQVGDILVSEGKIIKVGEDLLLDAPLIARAKGEKLETIDCTGLVAAPGFVDTHVHFRDPGLTYSIGSTGWGSRGLYYSDYDGQYKTCGR